MPLLSIVVNFFNMRREAERTLFSLCSEYQGVNESHYEVIVIDNGSSDPLPEEFVHSFGSNFRYIYFPSINPSPVMAINSAVQLSHANYIGILIDGARILSPGIIKYALLAFKAFEFPVISTLGCHIGHIPQQISSSEGYSQVLEDALLDSVDWKSNGYQLFDISCLAGSSQYGAFAPLVESNAFFLTRSSFDQLNGLDEAFISPGGGLVNLDFYQRAQLLPNVQSISLLGEATFHQYHGGVTTRSGDTWSPLAAEYFSIRKTSFQPYPFSYSNTIYFGTLPAFFDPWLKSSVDLRMVFNHRDEITLTTGSASGSQALLAPSRVIAILGMHRSGTSLLAGTLQEAGLDLGEVITEAPHNKKGNRESILIRTLHDSVLSTSGGSWDSPPSSVQWNTTQVSILSYILNNFSSSTVWGFKDPRSILCLQGWFDKYPNLECVAIFRHPFEVASSLAARNSYSLDFGLELWFSYNSILYELVVSKSLPLLFFDSDFNRFKLEATILIKYLDLPIKSSASDLAFYDPSLRHHNIQATALPAHVEKLYLKLLRYYKRQSIFQFSNSQFNISSFSLPLIGKFMKK